MEVEHSEGGKKLYLWPYKASFMLLQSVAELLSEETKDLFGPLLILTDSKTLTC